MWILQVSSLGQKYVWINSTHKTVGQKFQMAYYFWNLYYIYNTHSYHIDNTFEVNKYSREYVISDAPCVFIISNHSLYRSKHWLVP